MPTSHLHRTGARIKDSGRCLHIPTFKVQHLHFHHGCAVRLAPDGDPLSIASEHLSMFSDEIHGEEMVKDAGINVAGRYVGAAEEAEDVDPIVSM